MQFPKLRFTLPLIKLTLKVAMGIWKLYHQINLDYPL